MAIFNCLLFSVYFSFICTTAAQGENHRCENKTNNQNDTDNYQYISYSDAHNMVRDLYIKEFNSIMKIKNDRIKLLNEKIQLKNQIIRSNNNQSELESDLSTETQDEPMDENLRPGGLKDFVKKRIRSVFKKELNEIIQEKSVQIHLLEKLLEEKKKTIKLQKEVKSNANLIFGQGEPSA